MRARYPGVSDVGLACIDAAQTDLSNARRRRGHCASGAAYPFWRMAVDALWARSLPMSLVLHAERGRRALVGKL